jgi:hypothetical protein
MKGDSMNSVRRDAGRHFRKKVREYLKKKRVLEK